MFISTNQIETIKPHGILDFKNLVEFIVYLIISDQPADEKACSLMAHRVVPLLEAQTVNSLPFNVDF